MSVHLEVLARRIDPHSFALLPVAMAARDVVSLLEFIPSDSRLSSFIKGQPSSPELRPERLAQELKSTLALWMRFQAERDKQYNFD